MTALEEIVRPYVGRDVTPIPVHPEGVISTPRVLLQLGRIGAGSTSTWSGSFDITNYVGAVQKESVAHGAVAKQWLKMASDSGG